MRLMTWRALYIRPCRHDLVPRAQRLALLVLQVPDRARQRQAAVHAALLHEPTRLFVAAQDDIESEV